MYEFIECDFEDDFGFQKCLIHTYDMRHILNMNHVQCFNHVISPLIHSPRFIYQRGEIFRMNEMIQMNHLSIYLFEISF